STRPRRTRARRSSRSPTSWSRTGSESSASRASASRSGAARSWGSPASPATANRSSSRRWRASGRRSPARSAGGGQPAPPHSPRRMRWLGLCHVPEDRQRMGLVIPFSGRESAILGYQDEKTFNGLCRLRGDAVASSFRRQAKEYDIRPPEGALPTSAFSGGNQQKIVLARELDRNPDLLLVGQPTRGVDIGAIEFIHRRLVSLRDAGRALLVVSVELDEILALADRILVMHDRHIVCDVPQAAATERALGLMMAGEREVATG